MCAECEISAPTVVAAVVILEKILACATMTKRSASALIDLTEPPFNQKRRRGDDGDDDGDYDDSHAENATKELWRTTKKWRGVPAIAKDLRIKAITAVDPGLKHMGIVRISLDPYEITHFRLLSVDELRELHKTERPSVYIGKDGLRQTSALLRWYVERESRNGSIFDSDMLFVESQDFRRDMACIQTELVCAFNFLKQPVRVHGGPCGGGSVLAAQVVSASSKNSCYGGLFPLVAKDIKGNANNKKAYHGHGDVQNQQQYGTGLQYRLNKVKSAEYGATIAPISMLERTIPTRSFTASDRQKAAALEQRRKTDDLYDALFLALYAINTKLFNWSERTHKRKHTPVRFMEATPLRRTRGFEEVRDLMMGMRKKCRETESRETRAAIKKIKEALLG